MIFKRNKLFLLTFISFPLIGSDISLPEHTLIQRKELLEERNYFIIPYFQQDVIFPGLGAIFQYRNNGSNLGIELDAGISSIFWVSIAKKSVSGVYFFKNSGHQISLGAGTLEFSLIDSEDSHFSFMLPLAYSYKSKNHYFARLGVHALFDSNEGVGFLPFASYGYAF
jgi:hypothetical protein